VIRSSTRIRFVVLTADLYWFSTPPKVLMAARMTELQNETCSRTYGLAARRAAGKGSCHRDPIMACRGRILPRTANWEMKFARVGVGAIISSFTPVGSSGTTGF
jgi:hypothetical protein